MISLAAAQREVLERKLAVTNADRDAIAAFTADDAQLRMMFSGFDVDVDELDLAATRFAGAAVAQLRATILETLAGAWLDGVLTGLFIARQAATVDGEVIE